MTDQGVRINLRDERPQLVTQNKVVNPETIYTQATERDLAGYLYICAYICNNSKVKEAINLRGWGMKGLRGRDLEGAGGRRRKREII